MNASGNFFANFMHICGSNRVLGLLAGLLQVLNPINFTLGFFQYIQLNKIDIKQKVLVSVDHK
jgi:hypothetical protein